MSLTTRLQHYMHETFNATFNVELSDSSINMFLIPWLKRKQKYETPSLFKVLKPSTIQIRSTVNRVFIILKEKFMENLKGHVNL